MKRTLSPEAIAEQRQQLDAELRAGRLYLNEAARKMRAILCKSQSEFAVLLDIAPRTYIDFERGVGNPRLDTLMKIAGLFGLAVKFGPADSLHDRGSSLRSAGPTRRKSGAGH